jgi:hypothetical protein
MTGAMAVRRSAAIARLTGMTPRDIFEQLVS